MLVTFDAVEAALGIEQAGHTPPLADVSVTPTLHATRHAFSHAKGALIGLVVESVLRSSSGTPKRTTVSVSSSPSSRLAAAAGLICRSHFTVAPRSVRA